MGEEKSKFLSWEILILAVGLGAAGVGAYADVKQDITANQVHITGNEKQNDERYKDLKEGQKEIRGLLLKILEEERDRESGIKQRMFTRMVAKLIIWAYDHGYELTFGDAYRDPRVHGQLGERVGYGRANSNHKQRLAVDLNLFRDGKYLTETADHEPLGEYWESLGGSWGGRFNDGNHYSMEHGGRR